MPDSCRVDPVDELIELGGKTWRFIDTAGIRKRVKEAEKAEDKAARKARKDAEKAGKKAGKRPGDSSAA